jgi:altronate dehydratase large subunit
MWRWRGTMVKKALLYHPDDNVVTTLEKMEIGDSVDVDNKLLYLKLLDSLPAGHKVAIEDVEAGGFIVKYGQPIGQATSFIPKGSHVHTNNVKDLISDWRTFRKGTKASAEVKEVSDSFILKDAPRLYGYRRKDGRVGFRNHLLVMSTVICANQVVEQIGEKYHDVVALTQGSGCVILPNETERIRTVLLGMAKNPNVGAVIYVGLGCENIDSQWLAEQIKNEKPSAFVRIQDEGSTPAAFITASRLVEEMLATLEKEERTEAAMSDIVLATKCGGSDWTSAVVSNPSIGYVSDIVVKGGGISMIGETCGWFGGENELIKRARNKRVADQIMRLLDEIYDKSLAVGRRIDEGNPTPGNKEGGITTLVEKALGNVKKGGTAPIEGVLRFGEYPSGKGFYVCENAGLDPVSLAGLTCSSANIILFSTGRGTPTGTPVVPVIKISASPHTCATFSTHLDVDISGTVRGEMSIEDAGRLLFDELVAVANGKKVKAEIFRNREFTMPLLMGAM